MQDYRQYVFVAGADGRDHIARALDILAEDDAEAIALAKEQCSLQDCVRCELWHRGRMVRVLGGDA